MFSLLPLVKGWQYKLHTLNKDLSPSESSAPFRTTDIGWLMSILLVSTDAYGTVRIQYQDAALETHEIELSAENMRLVGAVQQDPSGWVQRYFRPNPNSSAGYYVSVLNSGGTQGSAWPFVPTTSITLLLGSESTQQIASVYVYAYVTAITDKTAFIQSLRQTLNSQADIDIPEELLSIGPTVLQPQKNETNELLNAILTELKQRK